MPLAPVTAATIIDPTTFGNAVVDAINPTTWTGVTFVNSWVNHGAPNQGVQYRKINDVVHLRGTAKNGTLNTTGFVLPAGFRPPASVRFGSADGGIVSIDSSGNVTLFAASNAIFSLDGISFSAT